MRLPTEAEMYQALCERHGAQMQRKFSEGAVAVCGLGGLGSNIAVSLARAGVGRLLLLDFDRVDLSNLNRQQYFPDQLGMPKAEALSDTLHRIAPYCRIESQTVRLSEENIPVLLRDYPVICEAFDRADQKAMLVNTVLTALPEAVLIAGSGMAGLGSPNKIRTRKTSEHFYLCGDGESDSAKGLGLISARVAVCAAHQATVALQVLAGRIDI
ncbi:MAG: sulfur carrier protein ThiS adenylyltransferase ThiF [Oscillospiraceae bacterium]|nr:sulfur carrier protein ThiS adenylyltransferase ThiF [Oscillospiraceae bacterium]